MSFAGGNAAAVGRLGHSGGGWRSLARAAAGLLTYPVDPVEYLDRLLPLASPGVLQARVEAVCALTPSAAEIVLRPGRGWQGHRPGQYLRLGVQIRGVWHWRAYSITSRVGEDRLRIAVQAQDGGVVSPYLVDELRPGTLVRLEQASGDFCLPDGDPGKVLLLAAGSGITPILGLLRNHTLRDAVLVYSVRSETDAIALTELRRAAARNEFRLVERHTDSEARLQPAELDAIVPDWAERQAWCCGPGSFVDSFSAHYETLAVADLLHVERFTIKRNIVESDGGEVRWLVGENAQDTVVEPGQSLLEAGEAAGVPLASGCRMGICHGCLVTLTEGAVRDLRNNHSIAVGDDGPETIQACVCTATGNCHITV